jgi:predicted outer membrane repeat protein
MKCILPLLLRMRCRTGCRFTGNKVYTDGGAIYINQWGLAGGRVEITDSYFAHNEVSTARARSPQQQECR